MLQGVMVMEQVRSVTQLTGGRCTVAEAHDPTVCCPCRSMPHGLGVVKGKWKDQRQLQCLSYKSA